MPVAVQNGWIPRESGSFHESACQRTLYLHGGCYDLGAVAAWRGRVHDESTKAPGEDPDPLRPTTDLTFLYCPRSCPGTVTLWVIRSRDSEHMLLLVR